MRMICLLAAGVTAWGQSADPKELQVQHADCLYLGAKRAVREAAALSALTTEVAIALPTLPPRSRSGALQPSVPFTAIDKILFAAMQENGITPTELTTDQEFLRRATLDLTGRIPTAQEVTSFLADTSPDKRSALVDRLLASPAWVDKWTMYFGDLFGNTARTTQVNRFPDGRNAFYQYIKSSLQQNKPYDQMARELISTAGSDSFQQGELNLMVGGFTTGGPIQDTFDRQAADVAAMFLGIAHMDCLLCHDGRRHLDSLSLWGKQFTRAQAWAFGSFFSHTLLVRVPTGQANQYHWSVLDNAPRANVDYPLNTTTGNRPERQPRPGQSRTVTPVYPFSGGKPSAGETYRTAVAREVTADFQFARAVVNYIWKQFFGIGIVDPPDQFDPLRLDPSNPPPAPWTVQPSNPQLLEKLAQDFVASRYDLKALMREIVSSRTYQLSARYEGAWNPAWDKFYARKLVRRLDAEEIHDALVLASGVPASYNIPGIGMVQWAMQFPDTVGMPAARGNAVTAFLDSFLRGNRDDVARSRETTLPQALNLMNDPFVLARIRAIPATSLLGRNINLPDKDLVEALFLNVLSRYPTEAERATAVQKLESGGAAQRVQNAQSLLWSLYNKVDFIFNY